MSLKNIQVTTHVTIALMETTYITTFIVAFVASILSGIAGGGVGFITTPFWLVIGMSPATGGATSAFMATGMSISSLATFRKSGHIPKDKNLLIILTLVALFSSIAGAILVPKIDIGLFKYALAIITILTLPLLFIRPNTKHSLPKHPVIGLVVASVFFGVGSIITSSAFSILFTLALVSFFGYSVLQTTALKRILFLVQSIVLLVGFTLQGYFVWQYGIAAFAGGILGAYIGTKYAVKKGEAFAKYALVVVSLLGAIALLAQS